MITQEQVRDVIGQPVLSTDGEKLGKAGQVFLDDQTNQPEWVTVNTGLFGSKESFVPLAQAQLAADGITVPYSKDQIKNAPSVDIDGGHLDQDEEADDGSAALRRCLRRATHQGSLSISSRYQAAPATRSSTPRCSS